MHDFVSIIMTHFAMNDERSDTMVKSVTSLFESTEYPFEFIVIDNGKSRADSEFFLDLVEQGKINTYIRNADNMHFGYARNQGIALAQGDYICITDNDILFKRDWLSECMKVLKAFPNEKIYATPIGYPTPGMKTRYLRGTLELDGVMYDKNMRAGSNCFVIKREDFNIIGKFWIHRIAGSIWTDLAVKKGYLAVVVPGNLITDMGFRRGYDLRASIPVSLTLSNRKKLYFNNDEFKKSQGAELLDFSCQKGTE